MIKFADYAKIANNYCVCYFGNSDEYLVQLRLLKPLLEKQFPDMMLYIGCRDDKTHLLKDCPHVLKLTELKIRKNDFAHISEIRYNGTTHPIEDFLIGAKITNFAIPVPKPEKTERCVIITAGSFPTKPLEKTKIDQLKKIAHSKRMICELDANVDNAGLVMGVESVGLCESAAQGIETILIPTGTGVRLYKSLFLNLQLMNI